MKQVGMKLKFFNREKLYIVRKRILYTTPLFLFVLNGCGHQPPAPVYGSGQPTNPYEEPYEENTKSSKRVTKRYHPSAVNEAPSDTNKQSSDNTVVKKPMSPAVLALVSEAESSSRSGDLESAVVTIERALRIDPRNPTLTYKLAALRLKQSKPRLAEDLAKKAALLSANDKVLKKKSWLLISEARRQQKNYNGAKEARLKAEEI